MKHFTKLFIGILFLILGGTQSGFAQTTIDNMLLEKAVDPANVANKDIYVYLYNVTNKKFVHGGGEFGAQAVLSDRGIRFKVTKTNDGKYRLESAIFNQSHGGGYLGVDTWNPGDARNAYKTYIDRGTGDDKSDIRFTQVADKNNIYELSYSGDRTYWYTYYDGGDGVGYVHVVDSRLRPDEWCLIKRDDYNTILADVAQQGRYNITGLIGNSRFLRNVSDRDNKFWSVTGLDYDNDDYCTTIDPHLGAIQEGEVGFENSDNYARAYGAFGCLEIGAVNASEESPVEFFQEITGLEPGLYMVEAQAFFDKNDYSTYKNGAYNNDNTTDASNAYLFANGAETLIPVLNGGDQTTFDGYVNDLKKALDYTYQEWVGSIIGGHYEERDGTNNMYFRRNVAAAYFLAKGNAYEPDESFHRVRVYVNVGEDGTLTLGVKKKGTGGRVYVDNFGLYYVGYNAIGLDAYQRDVDAVDHNKYQQSYTFHLSRKFVLNKWNAITLPMNVYGPQIIETFGDGAELCKLEGVNPLNKDQILFTPVDLTGDYSTPAIERGGCYLIKVTAEPKVAANESYKFVVKSEGDAVVSKDMVFPYGNIYNIEGVSCPEGMVTPDDNTVTTADEKLSYTYFYHRPGENQGDTPVPAGSYVMSDGKMYHLPQAWDGLLGTCWYITDKGTSSNSKVLAIDGEGGTTDINGIVTELPGDNAHEGVYNINGQKVADGTSLKNLPKGIYIMNGKKYVIK